MDQHDEQNTQDLLEIRFHFFLLVSAVEIIRLQVIPVKTPNDILTHLSVTVQFFEPESLKIEPAARQKNESNAAYASGN